MAADSCRSSSRMQTSRQSDHLRTESSADQLRGNWRRTSSPSPRNTSPIRSQQNFHLNRISFTPTRRGSSPLDQSRSHPDRAYRLEKDAEDDHRPTELPSRASFSTGRDLAPVNSNILNRRDLLNSNKTSSIFRSESLKSLHGERMTTSQSPGGEELGPFRRKPTNNSVSALKSLGTTNVELRSKVNETDSRQRKLGDASVQTELPETDLRHSYVQTDYVTDSVSPTGSDVSGGDLNADRSYEEEEEWVRDSKSRKYNGHLSEEDDSDNAEIPQRYGMKDVKDVGRPRDGFSARRFGKDEDLILSELDSELGNIVTHDKPFYMKKRRQELPEQSDHLPRRISNQEGSFSRSFTSHPEETGQRKSSQSETPMKFLVGVKPEQVLRTVPLGNWLLLDSEADGVYVEPWTSLGSNDRHPKGVSSRDFATQTFGQVMGSYTNASGAQEATAWHQQPDNYQHEDFEGNSEKVSTGSVELVDELVLAKESKSDGHLIREMSDRTVSKKRQDMSFSTEMNDLHEDDLTDEIIKVFKDTRQLIAEAAAGKPNNERNSGTSELIKIMINDVKALKDQVKQVNPEKDDTRKSGKRKTSSRRKTARRQSGSESDFETEKEDRRRSGERSHHTHHPKEKHSTRKEAELRNGLGNGRVNTGMTDPTMYPSAEPNYGWHQNTKENFDPMLERRTYDSLRSTRPPEQSLMSFQREVPLHNSTNASLHGPSIPQHLQPPQNYGTVQNNAKYPSTYYPSTVQPGYFNQGRYPATFPQPHIQSGFQSGELRQQAAQPRSNGTLQGRIPGDIPGLNGSHLHTQPHPVVSSHHQPSVVFVPTFQTPTNLPQTIVPGQYNQNYSSQNGRPVFQVPYQIPYQAKVGVPPSAQSPVFVPEKVVTGQGPPSYRKRDNQRSKHWKEDVLEFERSVAQAKQNAKEMKSLSRRMLRELSSDAK